MDWNNGRYHVTTPRDIKRLRAERRAHPSAKTNWALYGLSSAGYETQSGVVVNESTAQGLTAVYACIRVISSTVASLPFHLYERTSDDQRQRAVDHPLYSVISRKPNPEMTDMVFRETVMVHLLTWGNFYGQIDLTGENGKKAIWPLRPDRMRVKRIEDGPLAGVYYLYTQENGDEKMFTSSQILHIPGMGFDGLVGYSPIEKNKESIGLGMAAEQYGSRFFKNDARPGVVLKHPGELSDPAQDRLRKNWEKLHMGSDNAHRLAILEEGMDITTIGIPPAHAQWIELRNFQIPEICRIFGVPPPLIGDLSRATFSNIAEQNEHFGKYCIGPWLERIEQTYDDKLLEDKEKEIYYTEHLMDALLRADTKSRYETYAQGRQWGIFSANDVRRMENLDAIEGGDVYLSPSNMVPSDKIGEIPPAGSSFTKGGLGGKDNGRDLAGVFKPLLTAALQRVVTREILALSKAVGKEPEEFALFMDDLYDKKLRGYIAEAFSPVIRAYFEAQGVDLINVDRWTERFTEHYVSLSREALDAAARKANGTDRKAVLTACLESWKERKVAALADVEMEQAARLATKLH